MKINTLNISRIKVIVASSLLVMGGVLTLLPAKPVLAASTFTVNTENDGADDNVGDDVCETSTPGECTLRAAIEEANGNGNPSEVDTVAFAIPGAGVHELAPVGDLPILSEPIFIDGSTQGAVNCLTHSLLIEINGANFSTGSRNIYFTPGSEGSTLHAISTTGAEANMGVAGAGAKTLVDDVTFTCNNVGVKADGVTADGNSLGLVVVASNVTIGGDSPSDGNLIGYSETFGVHVYYDNLNHPATPTGTVAKNNTLIGNGQVGITNANTDGFIIADNTFDNHPAQSIRAQDSDNTVISGNTVENSAGDDGISVVNEAGSEVSDNVLVDNTARAISVINSDDILIQDNTVTGSTLGIEFSGNSGTVAQGNHVTDSTSGFALTNEDQFEIRGNVSGDASSAGILLNPSTNGTVAGNFIGVDSDGQTSLPVGLHGIIASGGSFSGVVIGGTNTADRNIVAHTSNGIVLFAASGLSVKGNYIGVDASGVVESGVGNSNAGILIGAGSNLLIGGTEAGAGNLISGNRIGVLLESSSGNSMVAYSNSILGNSIFQNDSSGSVGMGIDLADDANGDFAPDVELGVTPNDADDADDGPNYYLNHPEISTVTSQNDSVTITYDLDVDTAEDSATGYRVEFFANDDANPSGNGDGQRLIGYENISGDVTDHTVTLVDTGLGDGAYEFAATVTVRKVSTTGFGSTSEFSAVLGASITDSTGGDTAGAGSGGNAGNNANSGGGALATTGQIVKNSPAVVALLLALSGIALMRMRTKNTKYKRTTR